MTRIFTVIATLTYCLFIASAQAQGDFARCRADRMPPLGYPPMDDAKIGKMDDCLPGQEIDSICFDEAKVAADCEALIDGAPLSCHGLVEGLKADGDGFLAVRSGPSVKAAMVGQLLNGHTVIIWQRRGDWFFISPENTGDFRVSPWRVLPEVDCQGSQENLWVHRNWIKVLGVWSP